jgi:predicted ABC-type sugar transport system permease subunit
MGGMLLILASWIWHVLVAMGLAAIVISLVLEQYQTRTKDRCPFMEAQERA